MKKYLKMIRNIVFFCGIYLVITNIISFLYILLDPKLYKANTMENISKSLMNNIYILTAISSAITFIIYLLVLRNKSENLWARCNFEKIKAPSVFSSVLLAISLSAFSCSMVSLLQNKFESYKQVSDTIGAAYGSILSMVCIIILAPIFEEILFRGLIFNELKKNINLVTAVILQAIIFALFHGNMLQGIYTFILGIILSILYISTNSIWSNILCHIVYNLFGSLLMPLALSYTKNYVFVYIGTGLIVTAILLINLFKNSTKLANSQDLKA